MSASADAVKGIASTLRDIASRAKSADVRAHWLGNADVLEEAAAELIKLKGLTTSLPPDIGNIHDLPQEVLDELSITTSDETEDQLVTVINSYGGTATLDQILVGLYRKFTAAYKRRFLMNKLYRMATVWSVPGKKGVYTTEKPEIEEPEEDSGHTVIPTWKSVDEIPF